MCKKCEWCGKDIPYDRKHKRYRRFCNEDCRKSYRRNEIEKEKEYRKCIRCGKQARFSIKYQKWLKTCGSEECYKECLRLAQKKGTPNRIKFHISKKELEDLYIRQNKTRLEIANILGCSECKVKKFISHYGLFKDYNLRVLRICETKEKRYGDKG